MRWRRRYYAELAGKGGPRTFEVTLAGREEERDACSYLTWYYCDFLAAEASTETPPKMDEETLHVETLISWLNEFKPRTRMDAFPMLQVAISALNQLVVSKASLHSNVEQSLSVKIEELMCQLAEKDDRIAFLEQQVESMEQQANELMARASNLDKKAADSTAETYALSLTFEEKEKALREMILRRERESAHALNKVSSLEAEVHLLREENSRIKRMMRAQDETYTKARNRMLDKVRHWALKATTRMECSRALKQWRHHSHLLGSRRASRADLSLQRARKLFHRDLHVAFQRWSHRLAFIRQATRAESCIASIKIRSAWMRWLQFAHMEQKERKQGFAQKLSSRLGAKEMGNLFLEWKLLVEQQRKRRKVMSILVSQRHRSTLDHFMHLWRYVLVMSMLRKAGFRPRNSVSSGSPLKLPGLKKPPMLSPRRTSTQSADQETVHTAVQDEVFLRNILIAATRRPSVDAS
mmetsp:Transcript_24671/g.80862  ORF Transcript_24671/g.80862 Transcript_24671/m.80862 type:complete len:468 (+) Transcript_24671:1241-2644(+)